MNNFILTVIILLLVGCKTTEKSFFHFEFTKDNRSEEQKHLEQAFFGE